MANVRTGVESALCPVSIKAPELLTQFGLKTQRNEMTTDPTKIAHCRQTRWRTLVLLMVFFSTGCSRTDFVEGELGGVPVRIPDSQLLWPVFFNGDSSGHTSNTDSKIIRVLSIKVPERLNIPEADIRDITISAGESLRFYSFSDAYQIYEKADRDIAWFAGVSYQKSGSMYGLDVYRTSAEEAYKTKSYEFEIIYKHLVNGRVDSLIRCVDHKNIKEQLRGKYSCDQFFTLAPRYLAEVKVSYTEDHLPQWRQIESTIKRDVFSYADFNKESGQ